MLRTTRHRSTWRAFGLAFAIVLAPALMQTDDLSCFHSKGEIRLETLTIEVDGQDMLKDLFNPEECMYEVILPESYEQIDIGAIPMDETATVTYNLSDGCSSIEWGCCGEEGEPGGGNATLEAAAMPEVVTILKVWVHALEGKAGDYTVVFSQPALCI